MHKHSLVYLTGRILPAAVGFVAILLYSQMTTPSVYGEFAATMALANILNLGGHNWIRVGLTRFSADESEGLQIRWAALRLFCLINAGIGSALVALHLIGVRGAIHLPMAALLIFAMSWSDLNLEVLRAQMRSARYGVQYGLRQVLIAAISLGLIHLAAPGNPLLIGAIAGSLIASVTMFSANWRSRPNGSLNAPTRELVAYAAPLSLTYLLSGFLNNADKLIVTTLLGKHAGGIYSLAADVARQVVTTIMEAINLAAFPAAVRALEKQGEESARRQLSTNLGILLAATLPALVTLIACSSELAMALLGSHFDAGAAALMPLIAIATFLRGLRVFYFDQSFQLGKQTQRAYRVTLASAVLLVIALFLLIPPFGLFGAAWASIIAFGAGLLLSKFFGSDGFRMPVPGIEVLKAVGAAIALMAVMLAFKLSVPPTAPALLVLALSLTIGGLTYIAACSALDVCGVRSWILKRK